MDIVGLEKAYALLRRAKESGPAIRDAELLEANSIKLRNSMGEVLESFTSAREGAIQQIFDKIAASVLKYYGRLHDYPDGDEAAECTGLNLKATPRAAAGGLRLAIEFLNKAHQCNPRAFLSDGHLDSLGLCIYLATVRMFNEPGSLLILDDVLTSVDKEHRHRVADLLLEDFQDFQMIVTTHDERWFDILRDKVIARGDQKGWKFSRIARWTVEKGPESATFEGTWDWIQANVVGDAYRELGGSLRLVLEDFLKRVASKIELRVRFNVEGRHTAGDFLHAGIDKEIRDRLVSKDSDIAGVKRDLQRVFGTGDLINFLSHDNVGRLETTLEETKDFVYGLQSLRKRCETHKLIAGVVS